MLDKHPDWARTCDACQRFEHGTNGELSTTEERRPDGAVVELPIARQPGYQPPCSVCPKLEGVADKKPLDPADDFGGAFADFRRWWKECRAVGFPAGLDPLMRAVAGLFHDDAERRAADRNAAAAREAVAGVLIAIGVAKRTQ